MPATEFRVLPDDLAGRARDRKVRLLLWGAVAALSGTAVLGIVAVRSMSHEMESALVWTAAAITAGVVIGAYYLAYRHGLNKFRSSLVFLLTDTDLVRQRLGWPEVRLDYAKWSVCVSVVGGWWSKAETPRKRSQSQIMFKDTQS